jgi:hypothetical protein
MDGFGTFFTVASLHLVQYADPGTGRAQFLEFETKSGGVVQNHDPNGQFATFGADQVISVSWNVAYACTWKPSRLSKASGTGLIRRPERSSDLSIPGRCCILAGCSRVVCYSTTGCAPLRGSTLAGSAFTSMMNPMKLTAISSVDWGPYLTSISGFGL